MWICRSKKAKTVLIAAIPTLLLLIVLIITLTQISLASRDEKDKDDGTLEEEEENFLTCHFNEHNVCKQCRQETRYLSSNMNLQVKPCQDFYRFVCGRHDNQTAFLTAKEKARTSLKQFIMTLRENTNATELEKPVIEFIEFCKNIPAGKYKKPLDVVDTFETNFQMNKYPEYFGLPGNKINFNWLQSLVKIKHFLDMEIFFSVSVIPHIEKAKYVLTINQKPQPSFVRRRFPTVATFETQDPLIKTSLFSALLNYNLEREKIKKAVNVIRRIKNQLQNLLDKYAEDSNLLCTTIEKFNSDFTHKTMLKSNGLPRNIWSEFFKLLYEPLVQEFQFDINYDTQLVCHHFKTMDYLVEMYIWISSISKLELELFMWYTVSFELLQYTVDFEQIVSKQDVCSEMTMYYFEMPIAEFYPSNISLSKLKQMVDGIDKAILQKIQSRTWVDNTTLQRVLDKFKNRQISVDGNFNNESKTLLNKYFSSSVIKLDLTDNSLFIRNLEKIIKSHVMLMLNYIKVPVEGSLMLFFSLPFNFVFYHQFNLLRMHMGVGKYPIYFGNHPGKKVLTYAMIGFLIARAMAAAFNWEGIHHDIYGNMVDPESYWSSSMFKKFMKSKECFANIYKDYVTCDGRVKDLPGSDLDENIIDNAGVRFAYRAYKNIVKNQGCFSNLPGLKYTDDQIFFIAFATYFCEDCTPAASAFKTTPLRVRLMKTMQNNKDFAEAFACKVGDPMVPREKRCGLW